MQTFKIEQTETQFVVTWRHFSKYAFRVWLVGLTSWLVIFISLVLVTFGENASFIFLLTSPIWLMLLLAFPWFVHVLYGKTRLVLDSGGLETIYTCLCLERKKRIDLAAIHRFEKPALPNSVDMWLCVLRLIGIKKNVNITFPSELAQELDALCNQLNAFLAILKEPNV